MRMNQDFPADRDSVKLHPLQTEIIFSTAHRAYHAHSFTMSFRWCSSRVRQRKYGA